ncbi:hypothetical protein GCM10007304_18190 [Rhodococcoides trifolii]|uniref:Uncharacterized protein n=1 Tax=Rhodococcoides trifolii TaxID=908250 RepID=A0A917D072_9NOCA|nr:hypothetical protein [Rhodococcus trifolii]GGG04444.1 hypothetical protein GCM10007304_18190 [Rhodococcus trifolii]
MEKKDLQDLAAFLGKHSSGGTWRETTYAEFHRHERDDLPVLTLEYSADEGTYEAVWLVVDPPRTDDDPGAAADAAYAVGIDHALGVGL